MLHLHRSLRDVTTAFALYLAFTARPVDAQSHYYVRVGFGPTNVQPPRPEFTIPAVRHSTLTLGDWFRVHHGIEVSVSRMSVQTTEPYTNGMEAPYTVGLRATAIELGYVYRLRALWGRVQPRVGVGGVRIRAVDHWKSDTPTETSRLSVYGITTSVTLAVRVARPVTALLRSSYRRAGGERGPTRIGLDGFRFEGGLELGR